MYICAELCRAKCALNCVFVAYTHVMCCAGYLPALCFFVGTFQWRFTAFDLASTAAVHLPSCVFWTVYSLPIARIHAGFGLFLTRRSSGAPTAGHQARPGGTRYIFASPGLASCRRCPLSSTLGVTEIAMHPYERSITLLASAAMALASTAAYPVERVLMPDVPTWAKGAMAAVVFLAVFVLLFPVWLPALVPRGLPRLAAIARRLSGVLLILVGLATLSFALLVAGPRLHLLLLAALSFIVGTWHLRLASPRKGLHQ